MSRRKDSYRAALHRNPEPPGMTKVATLRNRYVRVTIELAPEVHRELAYWAGPPMALLGVAGATVSHTWRLLTACMPDSGNSSV